MVGKPTLRINAIKLSNGAKASDSVGLSVFSSESEALARKKNKKLISLALGFSLRFLICYKAKYVILNLKILAKNVIFFVISLLKAKCVKRKAFFNG